MQNLIKHTTMKGKIPYSIINSIPISSLQTVQVGKHVGIGKGSIIRGKVKIGDYSF
jgi:UDP-3-O-[3-hydroxymyristoyl] glucosamine N-acyltransferase